MNKIKCFLFHKQNIGHPCKSHFVIIKIGIFDMIQYETKHRRPSVTS